MKLVGPLVAALAIAACNGGSSNVPAATGMTGTPGQPMSSQRHAMPQWQAKGLARAACPEIVGKPACLALTQKGIQPACVGATCGFAPADFQTAYELPVTQGSGQIVAIVDAGDNPSAATDIVTYRSEFGLGTANFAKYNQKGQQKNYPPIVSGWTVEISLDIEMVSAVCPNCTIYLVEANNADSSDLDKAEKEAVKLGAHIISNSWINYGSNNADDPSAFDQPGVLHLAASGDIGYNVNGNPETLATVVSVGGTQLAKSGSAYGETVWPDAGGGCSSNGSSSGVAKPAWQHDPSCTWRTDSDISAEAGCSPGVAEYDNTDGGWFGVCGTSVASPMTAGIFALAGNATKRDAGRKFWELHARARAKDLHYISSGSDSGGGCGDSYLCTAGTKQFHTYAGPIGWGSPKGINAF